MACFRPMPAVRMSDGSVSFVSRNKRGVDGTLELPCRQCIGCRLERSRQWAMRCMHEASLYDASSFVTLTYDDESLPEGGTLDYPEFQKFMKRLRKRTPGVRFYMCGEYGEEFGRPHYHAILFGAYFADRKKFSRSPSGEFIYTSDILSELWPHGFASVGDVTFESAAYVARYCLKKVTGQLAAEHYRVVTPDGVIVDRVPEFNHMSLKPGVGAPWLDKFKTDVYPRDYVVVRGVKVRPPAYYDRVFKREDPGEYSEIVASREYRGYQEMMKGEQSVERLRVKEQVQSARLSFLKRSLK